MTTEEPRGEILLYQTADGRTRVECRFAEETLWLSQAGMAELFQVTVPTVNEHLKNIYAEAELSTLSTIRSFRIVRSEGKRQAKLPAFLGRSALALETSNAIV